MNNQTKLQIAKEAVRIWEEYPDVNWTELMEELKKWCKEMDKGVLHEMD